jgi:hypothetical protein
MIPDLLIEHHPQQIATIPDWARWSNRASAELCTAVLKSLPRSDQRAKGIAYIHGLLSTKGRKTFRNIAATIGVPGAEQSLHHFITSSTWNWRQVRRALAAEVTATEPPDAWVIRPMIIRKSGEHSVGVNRRFFPELGHVTNAQEAVGLWTARPDRSIPVNWRLYLSQAWLDDPQRRRSAAIPDSTVAESFAECMLSVHLEVATEWRLPPAPVVLDDGGHTDPGTALRRFRSAGLRSLIKINSRLRLTPAGRPLDGRSVQAAAYQVMGAVTDLRRPSAWRDADGVSRKSLVAAVRVGLPGAKPLGDLTLFGVCEPGERWPAELWLTDLVDLRAPELHRLTRLARRVDRDLAEITEWVGIRDFAGRSFGGWHRHATLASVAHAIVAAGRHLPNARSVPAIPARRTA